MRKLQTSNDALAFSGCIHQRSRVASCRAVSYTSRSGLPDPPFVANSKWPMAGAHFHEVLATLQSVDTWLPTAAKEQADRKSLGPERCEAGAAVTPKRA